MLTAGLNRRGQTLFLFAIFLVFDADFEIADDLSQAAMSAVNCIIVRGVGSIDGSNWDMGFMDCLRLGRATLA